MMLLIALVRSGRYGRRGNREIQGEASRSNEKFWEDYLPGQIKAERKRFRNFMCPNNQKCDKFNITKRMVKTNQDIIGEHIRNKDDVLVVTDEDKKIAWKSYHDKNSLSQSDTVSGVPRLIERHDQRVHP